MSAISEPSHEVVEIVSSATEGEGEAPEERRGESAPPRRRGRRNQRQREEEDAAATPGQEGRGPSGYSRRGKKSKLREEQLREKKKKPFVLPPDSENDDATDILPARLRLTENFPDYVLAGDDFIRISRWVSNLPRSRRSRYERALRGVISPTAIAGGSVWNCFGEGETDMGPMAIDFDGSNYDWETPTLALTAALALTQDWDRMRLSDVLPRRLFEMFCEVQWKHPPLSRH